MSTPGTPPTRPDPVETGPERSGGPPPDGAIVDGTWPDGAGAGTRRYPIAGSQVSDGPSGAVGVPGERDGAGLDRVRGPAPLVNAANALTVLRLVLVPLFVVVTVASDLTDFGLRIAACVSFCVASLTDFADGWIARTWDLVTAFGKIADPIADKALTGSALVMLSWYHRLPWWVTVLILVREVGVTLLRFWVIRRGVIAASRGGKVKTALQILAIAWYLAPFPGWLVGVGPWIMALAVVGTVATGLDYVARAIRLHRANA